ncbi:MAG: hypothetical protein ACI4E0_02280 [Blautia sp.]
MAVFTDDEIDRMSEERRKKKHGKIVSIYYRMKEHPAYKRWIGRLDGLAAVFMVITALGMTVFYVSIAYDYFHPDHDRISAEDAIVCSGNLVDITDESYVSRYGINHFIFDFKLDNGQILELEDELYLFYEHNLAEKTVGETGIVEYDDSVYLETITGWMDGLEPGDMLTYSVKKNARNRKYPEIYSLSVNGEELVSLDQINAVKYEQNLFFSDTWGILLIAVLAIWFGAYCFVTKYIKDRKTEDFIRTGVGLLRKSPRSSRSG